MPLLRSAARRARRKEEVLPLLDRNGGAEDTASGDDWSLRWATYIIQRAPSAMTQRRCARLQVGTHRLVRAVLSR